MADWKAYILSVVTVSLVCAVILQMASGKKEILQLVCGVVITLTVLQPVSSIRMEDLWDTSRLLPEPAEDCLTEGKKAAESFREEYITQAFAAYILDKAKTLGADLSAEITVDEDGLPVFAEMQGIVDEETRQILEQILICDLGITKENQRWTGNPGNSGCLAASQNTDM